MFDRIKRKLTSDSLAERIITTYIGFLITFFTITIVSYYLLPQGILCGKHPLHNWETSSNWAISTLQIFSYNLMSVIIIILSNILASKSNKAQYFLPYGYIAFFGFISVNAVFLGTWSFSPVSDAIPLVDRIIRTFDFFHRAGLWEMTGQLFVLCATAKISLIITVGKETTTKSWRTIVLSRQELIVFSIGLIFMLLGAIIESYAIINSL